MSEWRAVGKATLELALKDIRVLMADPENGHRDFSFWKDDEENHEVEVQAGAHENQEASSAFNSTAPIFF
jgi:hypothetical protein